jgi:hypothetical protein
MEAVCEIWSSHGGEDIDVVNGDSMLLRNVCIYLQVHTTLEPKVPTPTMEAVCSSVTLEHSQKTTRRNNSEDHHLQHIHT